MKTNGHKPAPPAAQLPKCPTGIKGLDEITGGGVPRGRPTLVCGGAPNMKPAPRNFDA